MIRSDGTVAKDAGKLQAVVVQRCRLLLHFPPNRIPRTYFGTCGRHGHCGAWAERTLRRHLRRIGRGKGWSLSRGVIRGVPRVGTRSRLFPRRVQLEGQDSGVGLEIGVGGKKTVASD